MDKHERTWMIIYSRCALKRLCNVLTVDRDLSPAYNEPEGNNGHTIGHMTLVGQLTQLRFTSKVGVAKVRQGFSMPPYGKDGGRTRMSY